MKRLRQAAGRERRAPIFWWFATMLAMGAGLFVLVYRHSPHAAVLMAVLLVGAWLAPVLAFLSLSAPARAKAPAPPPGEGTYDEWRKQARLLGRVLLYFEDHSDITPDLRGSLHAARVDLRDTFRAHPLRDDLERVCQRVREGAVQDIKNWFWHECHPRLREIQVEYEHTVAVGMDENDRLIALQAAVENAAAMMICRCMPRMLERERLVCARDCAWLAAQTSSGYNGRFSPIELASALVVEWCDFSEPWQPANVLHHAVDRLSQSPVVPASENLPATETSTFARLPHEIETEQIVVRNGKKYRRVKVRKKHRRHSRRYHGPTLVDVVLSFGQWLRYSVRSWLLYR